MEKEIKENCHNYPPEGPRKPLFTQKIKSPLPFLCLEPNKPKINFKGKEMVKENL